MAATGSEYYHFNLSVINSYQNHDQNNIQSNTKLKLLIIISLIHFKNLFFNKTNIKQLKQIGNYLPIKLYTV